MNTEIRTAKWLRMLGYDGDIPENLDICINSTSFIWDQLIQNSRSKIEISNMRNNILIHRLYKNSLSLNKTDKFQYPLQEVITYSKKCDLKAKLLNTNMSISKKQAKNKNIMKQNEVNCFSIEKCNLQINENQERNVILQEKLKIFDKDLQDANDILNFPINYNIADSSELLPSKSIIKEIQKYEDEVEEKVKQLPLLSKNTLNKSMFSTQKTVKKNSLFEQYLNLTEKQTSKKVKHTQIKKNIGPNKINICLFADDDNNTEKFEKTDIVNQRTPKFHIEGKDSTQILDELSFSSFLAPLPKMSTICSPLVPVQNRNRSYIYNKTKNMSNYQDVTENLLKSVFQECTKNEISHLINKYNRENIWNIFHNMDDKVHLQISKKIHFKNIEFSKTKNYRLEDLTRLQSLHVKTEFKIINSNALFKKLTEQMNKKKEELKIFILNSEYPTDLVNDLQSNFELQIENIGLECLLELMKKEINNIQNHLKVTNTSVQKSLVGIKEAINLKKASLIQYLEMIQEIFIVVNNIRDATSFCVRKLAPFTSDLTWYTLLKEDINLYELKVFKDFPLEYNRKFKNTNPSLYYRDTHTNKFLSSHKIDNDNLNMLTDLLASPFSAPEIIILNILCTKLKLEVLKSIKPVENKVHYKYLSKELQISETYINALQQLNALIASSTSKKTLSAASVTKNIMDVWIEMPFKDSISRNRTIDGNDYEYYEKMFARFYNNL